MWRRLPSWLRWGLITSFVLLVLYFVAYFPLLYYHRRAERSARYLKLHQIVLTMHIYNDTFKQLPPSAIRDKDGKPLLSWRVTLLQCLEGHNIYDRFKIDEPWDSPHNIQLLKEMPEPLRLPGQPAGTGMTHYQLAVGPGTAFERDGLSLNAIAHGDGTSKTILVVEARDAVPWTKPADFDCDPVKPLPELYFGAEHGLLSIHTFLPSERMSVVGLADGSPRLFYVPLDERCLRAMLTWKGGEHALGD